MTKRPQAVRARRNQSFKGRQFTAEMILSAVRWHLTLPIRYRDLEFMLPDRGVELALAAFGRPDERWQATRRWR
jgi:transposase, IS6 family